MFINIFLILDFSPLQVLLLPNFMMIVTSGLRVHDGFETIDMLEQVQFCQLCSSHMGCISNCHISCCHRIKKSLFSDHFGL